MESSSEAPTRRVVTVETARADLDLLTQGLLEEDRRIAVLGILTVLHGFHTRRGGVAPAWLLALMAEACITPEPRESERKKPALAGE